MSNTKKMALVDFHPNTPDGATICSVHYANGVVERSMTKASEKINLEGMWEPDFEPTTVVFSNDAEDIYTMPVPVEFVDFEIVEPEPVIDEPKTDEPKTSLELEYILDENGRLDNVKEVVEDPARAEAKELGTLLENYLKER